MQFHHTRKAYDDCDSACACSTFRILGTCTSCFEWLGEKILKQKRSANFQHLQEIEVIIIIAYSSSQIIINFTLIMSLFSRSNILFRGVTFLTNVVNFWTIQFHSHRCSCSNEARVRDCHLYNKTIQKWRTVKYQHCHSL